MDNAGVILCQDLNREVTEALNLCAPDKLFILSDETTQALCYPLLHNIDVLKHAHQIVIKTGDIHKNLETLSYVWQSLSDNGATRHSLLLKKCSTTLTTR